MTVIVKAHAQYTEKLKKQQPRRKNTDYLFFLSDLAASINTAQLN